MDQAVRVASNREFFSKFLNWEDDMRYVVRMAERMFRKRGVMNRPVWEREVVLEEWLDEPFDPNELAWARSSFADIRKVDDKSSGSSVAKKHPKRYSKLA